MMTSVRGNLIELFVQDVKQGTEGFDKCSSIAPEVLSSIPRSWSQRSRPYDNRTSLRRKYSRRKASTAARVASRSGLINQDWLKRTSAIDGASNADQLHDKPSN